MTQVDKNLIIFICNHGYAHEAMKQARKAGARGGTILHGRSSVSQEKTKFFGIRIHPEKDVVMIVCRNEKTDDLMKALTKDYGVESQARGLAFSLKVTDEIGFSYEPLPPMEDEE